jgi:hypothetical protein
MPAKKTTKPTTTARPIKYRAIINIDYSNRKGNAYQKLVAALIQSGWKYVETSAFIKEADTLPPIWKGIELVAKQSASIGFLSALTYHIQGSENFGGLAYPAAKNHPKAKKEIEDKPLP